MDDNDKATSRPVRVAVSVAVVIAMFVFALPRFADYGEAWRRVRAMDGLAVVSLVAVALWNLATYWFLLVLALPGLTLRNAAISNQASTAVANVAPAGGALGAGLTWSMYRSFGHSSEDITRSMATTTFWNAAVKLGTPAAAVLLLAAGNDAPPLSLALVSAFVLGLSVAGGALLLSHKTLLRRLAAGVGRVAAIVGDRSRRQVGEEWGERADATREETLDLVRDRWPALSLAAIVSHGSLFAVLLVALRHAGVDAAEVSVGEALTAFAVVRVLLIIPLTPGGAGLAEVGLSGLLVAAGGNAPAVVGAVLVFRALTWLLPVPLGAVSYLWWARSSQKSHREAVPA